MTAAGRANPPASANAVGSPEELALRISLDNFEPVVAFATTLDETSSVLAFNDTIDSARRLLSWVSGLTVCNDVLPAQLSSFCGDALPVQTMAAAVRGDLAKCRPGDSVWALPPSGVLSPMPPSTPHSFGGFAVTAQDMCVAGQPEFLTYTLLDGGFAELQDRCGWATVPIAVLSTSQSASYTTVARKVVGTLSAVASILDVLNTWDTSIDRFVMPFNVGN